LASPIPVATLVFPSGARAASAGTYILYASHIAAMAPGTNLGAATPVQIGLGGPASEPLPAPPSHKDAEPGKETTAKKPGLPARKDAEPGKAPPAQKPAPTAPPSTLTEKQIHDAAAYIRSLAQLRGRNAEWGEKAVREAVSLTAEEAQKLHVVDYVTQDVQSLLDRVQGSRVAVRGTTVTLDTAGAAIIAVDPDFI